MTGSVKTKRGKILAFVFEFFGYYLFVKLFFVCFLFIFSLVRVFICPLPSLIAVTVVSTIVLLIYVVVLVMILVIGLIISVIIIAAVKLVWQRVELVLLIIIIFSVIAILATAILFVLVAESDHR